MFGWLFAPPAERRLLAVDRGHGPTTYLIGIMTFAMVLVAAAGLALTNAAAVVASGVENRYAVQLPGEAEVPRLLAAARTTPGIARADPVPQAEIRATLEEWLGPSGLGDALPVPALVTLDLTPQANAATIGRTLESVVPGARFVAYDDTLRPLLRSLGVLQWLALSLVMLMAVATAAAVILAARGALDTHRFTIEVMHGIGATDAQVTRLFQRSIALDALKGALSGGAAAALALLILGGGSSALGGELAGARVIGTRDIVILALLPLAAVALATWVARLAVLAAMRRAP